MGVLAEVVRRVDDDRLPGDAGRDRPLGVAKDPVDDVGDDVPLEARAEGPGAGLDPAGVRADDRDVVLSGDVDESRVCLLYTSPSPRD